MKKARFIGISIIFGILFIATLVYLISKANTPQETYSLEEVQRRDLREIIIASGSVLPEKEIEVKSSLSGVIDEIYVKAGEQVRKGTPLLSIKVIPNILDLNSTRAARDKARIRLEAARDDMERQKKQYEADILPEVTYLGTLHAYEMAVIDFNEIENRMKLIEEGISSSNTGSEGAIISNVVYAPITGTILEIPVKEGTPIQENSGMSQGTTVATLADMDTLYFEGEIDETEVGELATGMPVRITVAALDSAPVDGTLSFISPRGRENDGSVMFPVKIEITAPRDIYLRAGYSASAEIILNSADNVISIPERDLLFEEGKTYVEISRGEQVFEKIEVETGISDGVYTQITRGLSDDDKIKAQI